MQPGATMPKSNDALRVFSWSIDMPDDAADRLMALLSRDERARAQRLAMRQHAVHFIAARAGLRLILGETLAVPASDIHFDSAPTGKPLLRGQGAIHFNLSHSQGLAVLALSPLFPIGIDLEFIRPLTAGIEAQFLTPAEIAAWQTLEPAARNLALVTHWAAKEAIIKLQGDIRKVAPKDIELSLDLRANPPATAAAARAGYALLQLPAPAGYVCMLASNQPITTADIAITPWTGLDTAPTLFS
jgi:4'-phosphopantetheinyl transferase